MAPVEDGPTAPPLAPAEATRDSAATPGKGKGDRGTVRPKWRLEDLRSSPRDGWILPDKLEAHWTAPDGGIPAHVVVEVFKGKARRAA